jgi:hypothetical protein
MGGGLGATSLCFFQGTQMKMYIILFFLIIVFLSGCKSKTNGNKTPDKEFVEEIIEKAHKKNDISIFFNDSISSGKRIKEAFLTFEFGDTKKDVINKIDKLIKARKIIKKDNSFDDIEIVIYLYQMKFEEQQMEFTLNFEYINDMLYHISLFHFKHVGSIPYWDKEKIVKLYKDKYKNEWIVNKYTPINTSYENEEYENLEGTRYISLNFTDHSLNIDYKDIMLEKLKRDQNISDTKKDI